MRDPIRATCVLGRAAADPLARVALCVTLAPRHYSRTVLRTGFGRNVQTVRVRSAAPVARTAASLGASLSKLARAQRSKRCPHWHRTCPLGVSGPRLST